MKKSTLIFLLSFFYIGIIFSQEKNQITYIANEGVFIEYNGKHVFIDALHDEHSNFYEHTRKPYRLIMNNASAPFERIDLFLVTHVLGDHFDADLTIEFFEKHKETILVAPQQVLDTIGTLAHLAAQFYPLKGTDNGVMYAMDGITIQTFPLIYSTSKENNWLENMAYILDFDGLKILHAGDAEFSPENLSRIKKAIGKGVDYAILPDWFFENKEGIAKVKRQIKAKKYIAAHVLKSKSAIYSNLLKKRVKEFDMDLTVFLSVGQFETIKK